LREGVRSLAALPAALLATLAGVFLGDFFGIVIKESINLCA
jgi:hypothetical protein